MHNTELPSNTEKLRKEFEADPNKLFGGFRLLANKYKLAYATVRNAAYLYRKKNSIKSPHNPESNGESFSAESISTELLKRRESAIIKSQGQKIKVLIDEVERISNALDNSLAIKERTDYKSQHISWNNSIKGEAAVLTQFSDWHVGKRIDKKTTNGLNEYNPDIAKSRSESITRNLLKLVRKERQDIKINNLVINLGGDAINNFLHEGDAQQNYYSPLEEVRYAKLLIGNALKTIAEEGEFKKIVLLCMRGNHPRLTKKMQSNVDHKMNLEAMMYWILRDEFNDKLFEWHVPESDIGYYTLGEGDNKKVLRYFHAHQISYQGGLGGLTIPMNKKIMYWDKTFKADYDMASHWHTYQMIGNRVSVNGSLCGYDEYAQSCGFSFEPPVQVFQLLDKNRGFTVRTPILSV